MTLAGRCVEFILELAARVEEHEERLARLEAQARQDSRPSSRPPSSDPPKTRAQRRAEARAKAKELMRSEGEGRAMEMSPRRSRRARRPGGQKRSRGPRHLLRHDTTAAVLNAA